MTKSKSKSKPAKKASAPKTKPAKVSSSAKKDNKKTVKKLVVKAKESIKKSASTKTQKVVSQSSAKKATSKKEKDVKKTAPLPLKKQIDEKINAKSNEKTAAKSAKAESKAKSKSKKPEKKSDDDFDDDIIGDDFGESEIAEYEDDLKAVEDDDDDSLLDLTDDEDTEVKDEEIYLTDSEGRRLCRVRDCDQVSTVEGYCRYHYLLLWKKIQIRKHILIDGKLEKYIDDLMARYPDKFLEVIRKDLKTEKDFLSVIQEMELDDSVLAENDGEDEVQSFADEIRGIGEAPAMDDDGDF